MEDKIITIKLITGEEIIAQLVSDTDSNVLVLRHPLMLGVDNSRNLSLTGPIMFSANPERPVSIYKTAISFFTYDLREELKNGYLSEVSSLILPSKRIIMG